MIPWFKGAVTPPATLYRALSLDLCRQMQMHAQGKARRHRSDSEEPLQPRRACLDQCVGQRAALLPGDVLLCQQGALHCLPSWLGHLFHHKEGGKGRMTLPSVRR